MHVVCCVVYVVCWPVCLSALCFVCLLLLLWLLLFFFGGGSCVRVACLFWGVFRCLVVAVLSVCVV